MRIRSSWLLVAIGVAFVVVLVLVEARLRLPAAAAPVSPAAANAAAQAAAPAPVAAVPARPSVAATAKQGVAPIPAVLQADIVSTARPADPAAAELTLPPTAPTSGYTPEQAAASSAGGELAVTLAPASAQQAGAPPPAADSLSVVGQPAPAAAPTAQPDAGSWRRVGTGAVNDGRSLNAVAGTAAGEFWAVGDGGEVWHLAAGAATWNRVPLAAGVTYGDNLNAVYPVPGAAGRAWAVGNRAGIFQCFISGCSQVFAVGVTGELDSIWMTTATDGWAVGARGMILHYTGGAWQRVVSNPPLTAQLHAVQMLSDGEGYAVGERGTILHYHNGTWTPVGSGANGPLVALWFISPAEGWIVGGANGGPSITYHYLNGVVSPETAAPETGDTRLWYVYMFPDGTGWAVANGGYITRRDLAGVWSLAYTAPGGPSIFGVWMNSPRSGWAVAGDGTIEQFVRSNP